MTCRVQAGPGDTMIGGAALQPVLEGGEVTVLYGRAKDSQEARITANCGLECQQNAVVGQGGSPCSLEEAICRAIIEAACELRMLDKENGPKLVDCFKQTAGVGIGVPVQVDVILTWQGRRAVASRVDRDERQACRNACLATLNSLLFNAPGASVSWPGCPEGAD